MQRFYIDIGGEKLAKMYYPSIEEARTAYPDAASCECGVDEEKGVKECYDSIFGMSYKTFDISRNDDGRCLHYINTPFGLCQVVTSYDKRDGKPYDICKYRLFKHNRHIEPVTWDVSSLILFLRRFDIGEFRYSVISSSPDTSKPKCLKGIKQFDSAYYERRKCPLYIDGLDLYIQHNDYFSPSSSAFDEPDGKGKVYIRKAWLKLENFTPLVYNLNPSQIAKVIWKAVRDYHCFGYGEINNEWERFAENVAKATRRHIFAS